MICVGFAMASTIRIGNQLGQNNISKLKDAGYSAIIQVVVFMVVAAVFFILLRDWLPTIYIDDVDVLSIASVLLIYAAIFQIPDGIQVATLAMLRGIQDVKIPTIITFISYWLIGIPFSYVSAIYFDWGALGVWMGLIIALTISAILLTLRFRRLTEAMSVIEAIETTSD